MVRVQVGLHYCLWVGQVDPQDMEDMGLDNFQEVHLVVQLYLEVPLDWVDSHLAARREAHQEAHQVDQVDLYHLKIALKVDILVPEYLEDSQGSY